MDEERRLNLSTIARRHFRLSGRDVSPDELRTINAAVRFAHACLLEYQRLEEENADAAREDYLNRREPIQAEELVAVVELGRALRGRDSTAGDLWQAIAFMLDRNLAVCDWELLTDELEELASL